MMANLSHRGYVGSIEVSIEDGCMHGRVLFINDLITYEGETVAQLTAAFNSAVERYLAHCKETGKEPNKPCSGTFQVRLGEALHRQASIEAQKADLSLNEFVVKAVEAAVQPPKVVHEHRWIVEAEEELSFVVAADWTGATNATLQ